MIASLSAVLLALVVAPDAEASVGETSGSSSVDDRWLYRHRPRRNMFHLGVFGGAFFPARDIELFELDTADAEQGFRPYGSAAPEFGARFAYFPLDFLGLEVEGAVGLGALQGGERATFWAGRGHVIGQVARWSISPFVLAGAGALGVRSKPDVVGNDTDLAFHFGGGLMVHLTRALTLRLDVRNVISPQRGEDGGATNSPEILLGLGWTRRPTEAPQAAPRVVVAEPAVPVGDGDGDGFIDDEDACPEEAGVAPDGCPDLDPDGDGVLGPADLCPEEKGPQPDGCPVGDDDGDGFANDVDACPNEPETRNGFDDEDGCPDELPKDLGSFEGTLEGVKFQIDSATLRPGSKRKLDDVVEVLLKYPEANVEISGHTDSTGSTEHNLALSKERAEVVKAYFVQRGVAGDRVQTRGAGPDEPIDTNASAEGRANNRRIEFKLLNCSCGG